MTPHRIPLCLIQVLCVLAITACAATELPNANSHNVLITHDVRGLVAPWTEKASHRSLEALAANIKASTGPSNWSGNYASIEPIKEGYLLVKAKPPMQKLVTSFLDDMERFGTALPKKK